MTLGEAAALWIALHEQTRPTFFQIRQVLHRLIDRHGRDPIDQVGHRELDAWLRTFSGLSPVTRHNYWRITRRFFGWAQDYLEAIPRNPMKKLQERRLEHRDPAILTPTQMAACLEAASGERPRRPIYASAGSPGFGPRRSCASRGATSTGSIGEVYVAQPKRVAGWRPRHVEILPALRRHLEPLALKEGPILTGGQPALYILRLTLRAKLGLARWPQNCLRHSFKTYHAAFFQDLQKLTLQMGHAGSDMTHYVYGTPATRGHAAAWWAL